MAGPVTTTSSLARWQKVLVALSLLVLVAGCRRRGVTLETDTPTAIPPPLVETATPDIGRPITPTATEIVLATGALPSPTVTRDATPTADTAPVRPTPTAPAVSALSLGELLLSAERVISDGDYEQAIDMLRTALEGASGQERPLIALPLARVLVEDGRHTEAIPVLQSIVTATLALEDSTQAWGLLARSHGELGHWRASIDAYRKYLGLEDAAEPYVRWQIAQSLVAQESYEEAVEEIRKIPLDGLDASMRAEILEELAEALRRLEDYDGAVAAYEQILEFARNAEYRALVTHKLASAYGEAEQGGAEE